MPNSSWAFRMTRLQTALNIKPGEWRPVVTLLTYYFFVQAIPLLMRSARSAYFLDTYDNAQEILPLIMLTIPFLGLLVVAVLNRLARSIKLVPLVVVTSAIFAGSLLLVEQALARGVNTKATVVFLYGWADVISTLVAVQFWLIAGLIFDTRQAKRLFSIIGIGGTLGSIIIGLIATPLVSQFGANALLFMTAVLLVVCLVMAIRSRPYIKDTSPKKGEPAQASPKGKLFDNYLVTIAIVVGITLMAAAILEYQFQIVTKSEIKGQDDLATFFNLFYVAVGLLALLMRLFVVNRILTNGGVLASLLSLPIILMIGAVGMLISPFISGELVNMAPLFIAALLTKGGDQIVRYTVYDTATELVWVPIEPQRKIRAKPVVNGVISSMFKGMAAVLMFLFVQANLDFSYVGAILLVLTVFWIPAVFIIRKGYVDQLLTSIQKRQLKLEDLTLDIRDNTIVENIRQLLRSQDERDQAFGLELIQELDLRPWHQDLRALFDSGDIHIKQNILQLAADLPTIVSDTELMKLIYTNSGLTDEAILMAARRKIPGLVPLLERYLDDPSPETRAAAAKGTLVMQQGPLEKARETLEKMLREPDTKLNTLALNMLVDMPKEFPRDLMRQYLHRNTTHVVKLSLAVAQQLQSSDNGLAIADIAYNLRRPRTALLARQVLKNYPDQEVINVLLSLAADRTSDRTLRIGIISTLRDYPEQAVINFLIKILDDEDIGIYSTTVNTLLDIARQGRLPHEAIQILRHQMFRMAQFLYRRFQTQYFLRDSSDKFLLMDLIDEDIHRATPALLKLTVMNDPETPIETVIYNIEHNANMGNVLEFLDNIFTKEERTVITPLFENIDLEERCLRGYRHFENMPRKLDDELRAYIHSNDTWRSVIALDYAIRHQRIDLLQNLNWKELLRSRTRKDMVTRHLAENGAVLRSLRTFPIQLFPENTRIMSMYSTLEKTILLKHVELFQSIPARDISHLAQIAREVEIRAGERLFEEGEPGDDMYVISEGQIRIHNREGVEIAVLEKGYVLGEMAILDREPRSASATAIADSILLKINRTEFFELMASRIEIMEGIIQMLTSRLRNTLNLTQTNIPR